MVATSGGPTILITDGWLANAGDAAINVATTLSLQRQVPHARVALAGHHRGLVGDLYPELDLVPPIDSLAGVEWPWTTAEDLEERETIEKLVDEADLVVAAGGGYMLERYKPEGRIRGYELLLERGKRLVLYAQSIGRFTNSELRTRLGAVLEAAELVLVRDEPSLETVRKQRREEGLHLTADEGFLFPPIRRVSQPRSLLMTASVHPWEQSQAEDALQGDSHLREIAASLSRLLASGAARSVTLASTTQGLGAAGVALEDDEIASHAIRAAIPPHLRNRVKIFNGYLTAGRYAELAARHTAAISMRMHGAILAAAASTPVLTANASEKTLALSGRTGGGMTTIAGRRDLARLDELVAPMLEDPRPARVRQNAAVGQMRKLAHRNAELVAERL